MKYYTEKEHITANKLNQSFDNIANGVDLASNSVPLSKAKKDDVAVFAKIAGAAQTIANATWTRVLFSDKILDRGAYTVTNNQITINKEGIYLVIASLSFDTSAAGNLRSASIYINGNGAYKTKNMHTNRAPTTVTGMYYNFVAILSLSKNDTLELYAYQDSGGSLALNTSTSTNSVKPSLSVNYLGNKELLNEAE